MIQNSEKIRVGLYIEKRVYKSVQEICKEKDLTISSLVSVLLRNYINNYVNEKKK